MTERIVRTDSSGKPRKFENDERLLKLKISVDRTCRFPLVSVSNSSGTRKKLRETEENVEIAKELLETVADHATFIADDGSENWNMRRVDFLDKAAVFGWMK